MQYDENNRPTNIIIQTLSEKLGQIHQEDKARIETENAELATALLDLGVDTTQIDIFKQGDWYYLRQHGQKNSLNDIEIRTYSRYDYQARTETFESWKVQLAGRYVENEDKALYPIINAGFILALEVLKDNSPITKLLAKFQQAQVEEELRAEPLRKAIRDQRNLLRKEEEELAAEEECQRRKEYRSQVGNPNDVGSVWKVADAPGMRGAIIKIVKTTPKRIYYVPTNYLNDGWLDYASFMTKDAWHEIFYKGEASPCCMMFDQPATPFSISSIEPEGVDRSTQPNRCCVVCNKEITSKEKIWVHLDQDMDAWPVETEISEQLDMGWHEVGAGCAKKIPARFKSKTAG